MKVEKPARVVVSAISNGTGIRLAPMPNDTAEFGTKAIEAGETSILAALRNAARKLFGGKSAKTTLEAEAQHRQSLAREIDTNVTQALRENNNLAACADEIAPLFPKNTTLNSLPTIESAEQVAMVAPSPLKAGQKYDVVMNKSSIFWQKVKKAEDFSDQLRADYKELKAGGFKPQVDENGNAITKITKSADGKNITVQNIHTEETIQYFHDGQTIIYTSPTRSTYTHEGSIIRDSIRIGDKQIITEVSGGNCPYRITKVANDGTVLFEKEIRKVGRGALEVSTSSPSSAKTTAYYPGTKEPFKYLQTNFFDDGSVRTVSTLNDGRAGGKYYTHEIYGRGPTGSEPNYIKTTVHNGENVETLGLI